MTTEQTLEQSVIDAISEWVGETSSDHLVAAARAAVAALRAAGEPVAYRWRPQGAVAWVYDPEMSWFDAHRDQIEHEPLYAAQPAPSASVRKGAQHGATIEDAKAAIERGEYSDLPPLNDSRRTPSPLMAAGEAAPQASAESVNDLRSAGWTVAVHNDYRLNGKPHTFWLFTKGDRAIKGEGSTDQEALDQCRALAARVEPQPSRIDAAARASETVEATSPIDDVPSCGQENDQRHASPIMAAALQAEITRLRAQLAEATSPAKRDYAARVMGDRPITRNDFVRLGILGFKEPELREIVATFCKLPGIAPTAAEPTREEIAAKLAEFFLGKQTLLERAADAILALKPRGGQTREGGK